MSGTAREIEEAIAFIHQHIHDPLSLSQLARHVGYSPYHFIRLFKSEIGLSPYYYISSLRLQKAKDLLIHTHLPVRDIAMEVGYQSLGTFTTRFSEKVGVSPNAFRHQKMLAESQLLSLRKTVGVDASEPCIQKGAKLVGSVHTENPFEGIVFVGMFLKPIPDAIPVYGTILMSPGRFSIANIRPGTYYLMATSVSWEMRSVDILLPYSTLRTRHHPPLVVRPGEIKHHSVTLYPPRFSDPPILISLSLLMNRYLERTNRNQQANPQK